MPDATIRHILDELEDDIQPYSMEIKPRIGDKPLLEIIFGRRGDATYTLDFQFARDVGGEKNFITPELLNTSPVLLVEFDEDQHGAIDTEQYLGCSLIYDTFERKRDVGSMVTVAEYYSFAPELINDTQQPAWHLTHRDLDDPEVYAFV